MHPLHLSSFPPKKSCSTPQIFTDFHIDYECPLLGQNIKKINGCILSRVKISFLNLEAKTFLKRKSKTEWKKKNNNYSSQKDQINSLDRRSQTTILRLRTGHCGLNKHLKRLGLRDTAQCVCGSEEQTPEHILHTCPHLETACQHYWPEDTTHGIHRPGDMTAINIERRRRRRISKLF
ncbi:hypothetical protein V1264_021615 [Littorina saxatilis]|uniref:Uncharacterized protein n=1 Tax=Littorina saxatilis TaxID=31220 RepID=A0AAN9AIJ7_9CAEN